MSDLNITTLENGMRVVSDAMPGIHSAAVGVWVAAGARHETEAEHGVAHFLEHMAFKGTRKRSALAIAEEIEAVGGHLNACTMREQTSYYARVLPQDVPLALDILADILTDSVFDDEELAREKQVVLQEIAQVQDTPDDLVFDDLQAVCFPGSALGRPILGTVESVMSLARQQLFDYMAKHYAPSAMVLSAAGAVDHRQLVDATNALFGNKPVFELKQQNNGAFFSGKESRRKRDSEQAHVALAFEGVAFADDDFFTAQVYSAVLGGGMSSRLFQEVREKRGLCYSVFSFSSSYEETGMIGVYAGTGRNELSQLMPVLAGEMARLAQDATETEVGRARAQLKAGLLMNRESPAARAEQAARDLLIFGHPWTPQELIAAVDNVDARAVRDFGGKLIRSSKPALAAVGAIDRLADYESITANFG
jgi:predicted Zn-dependent peptidase